MRNYPTGIRGLLHKHLWPMLFLVTALALLTAVPAVAHVVKTSFTGTDVWVEDSDPGTEIAPPDGGQSKVRGALSRFTLEVSDPRVSGDNTVTVNWNFKLVDPPVYVTGLMWGTFRITNAGGYWKGVWAGYRDKRGYSYIDYVGTGGADYAGLKLRLHIERLDPDPTTLETVTGYILERGD
jgi:hypothetical protein